MPSRDLTECHPALQRRYLDLVYLWDARYAFRKLFITCTHRSREEQIALWEQGRVTPGRIVTFCNGTTTLSPHNREPAEAIDVAIRLLPGDPEETVLKEAVTWKAPLYWPLVKLASLAGLVSGGTFRIRDWPHLELPASFSSRTRAILQASSSSSPASPSRSPGPGSAGGAAAFTGTSAIPSTRTGRT